jgi:aminotransferase
MRVLRPLDNLNYNKALAITELERTVGWRSYGRKHGESLFTKLFQNHYLPLKFGYDKRRPHLASLIASGQLTREQALVQLEEPLYDANELQIDIAYFCKKLRISKQQFEQFMADPPRRHEDFASWKHRYAFLKAAQSTYQKMTGRRMSYG